MPLCLFLCACGSQAKLSALRQSGAGVPVSVAGDILPGELDPEAPAGDTMRIIDANGREILIMRAVEGNDGELSASDAIAPAIVRASFRNAAERRGKVELRFDVTVPASIMDSRWQLRLSPTLTALGEDHELDRILVTGEKYREEQLEGYRRYQRYLDAIITDSLEFVRGRDLRIFLERNGNYPYGKAREHYTDRLRIYLNDLREAGAEAAFRRLVPSPILSEGIRLDTVIRTPGGDLQYCYAQTIEAKPRLRKALITLKGSIYDREREILRLRPSDSLTFYISSLSGLIDWSLERDDAFYATGLDALRNQDYALAISLLKPFDDFNTALSYAALDYNASSLDILERTGSTPRADYLKSILYSRRGDERSAVEAFIRACTEDPSFIHRGNLDPEISSLIKKYKLKPLEQNETFDH